MPRANAPLKRPSAAVVMAELRALARPHDPEEYLRFGIATSLETLGVSVPEIRALARGRRRDHALARDLWKEPVHEARILATLVDDPNAVGGRQMDQWIGECDSWALVDSCCGNLFDRTDLAIEKAHAWSLRTDEFGKRGAFSLMAFLALKRHRHPDSVYVGFLPVIAAHAGDPRNFVKKAVNWALRQVGKRNRVLRKAALRATRDIHRQGSPSARWIASDAIRELRLTA